MAVIIEECNCVGPLLAKKRYNIMAGDGAQRTMDLCQFCAEWFRKSYSISPVMSEQIHRPQDVDSEIRVNLGNWSMDN